jgi:hypothetical protein
VQFEPKKNSTKELCKLSKNAPDVVKKMECKKIRTTTFIHRLFQENHLYELPIKDNLSM